MKNHFGRNSELWKVCVLLLVGLSLSIFSVGRAFAVPVIYFGEDLNLDKTTFPPVPPVPVGGGAETARNDFLSNLVGVSTEDFSTFTEGQSLPLTTSFSGVGTAELTTTALNNGIITSSNDFQRFATSGSLYLDVQAGFTISFLQPVAAFGFYGTDIGDVGGQFFLTLDNGQILNIPHTLGPDAKGALLFFGIIDQNPFTSLTFGNTSTGFFVDGFGFDDFMVGSLQQVVAGNQGGGGSVSTTPEPSTVLLLGSGLVGIGLWRAKKSRK